MPFQIRIGTTEGYARGTTNGGVEGVDYIEFPISSTYQTTASNVVDSSRNSKAVLIASPVRMGVRRIDVSYRVISISDYSKLAKFFNTNFLFYAYYFDQDDKEWQARQVYVNDRKADALKSEAWKPVNRGGGIEPSNIENFKIALIEA